MIQTSQMCGHHLNKMNMVLIFVSIIRRIRHTPRNHDQSLSEITSLMYFNTLNQKRL